MQEACNQALEDEIAGVRSSKGCWNIAKKLNGA